MHKKTEGWGLEIALNFIENIVRKIEREVEENLIAKNSET